MTGYTFTVGCPNCGWELEQVNVWGTPARQGAVLKCSGETCHRQFELYALLLPFAQPDSRRRASYRVAVDA